MAERSSGRGLGEDFEAHLRRCSWYEPGEPLVVAVSGGLDSVVLLHLLRFGILGSRLIVAHFDHRMRAGSHGDRLWVGGLARTWGADFVAATADEIPGSEASARTLRYRYLERVRSEAGARWVLTAHHSDDQAETVLHRALRGSGPDGLAGIRETREPGVARPLLPFHRGDLEVYAREAKITHRSDPSNTDTRYTRNWIRNEMLPRLDDRFGSGGRRALARLARLSAIDADAWDSVLRPIEAEVVRAVGAGELDFEATVFLALHPGVQARLVRRLAARLGGVLDARQTESVLSFVQSATSGRVFSPRAGLEMRREFDRVVFSSPREARSPEELHIRGASPGRGSVALGERVYWVHWSWGEGGETLNDWTARFSSELRYPARIRAWCPGDRLAFEFGSKKLKKIFGEARVPARARASVPVLVDSQDRVLWVPGVARSRLALPSGGGASLTISFEEQHS